MALSSGSLGSLATISANAVVESRKYTSAGRPTYVHDRAHKTSNRDNRRSNCCKAVRQDQSAEGQQGSPRQLRVPSLRGAASRRRRCEARVVRIAASYRSKRIAVVRVSVWQVFARRQDRSQRRSHVFTVTSRSWTPAGLKTSTRCHTRAKHQGIPRETPTSLSSSPYVAWPLTSLRVMNLTTRSICNPSRCLLLSLATTVPVCSHAIFVVPDSSGHTALADIPQLQGVGALTSTAGAGSRSNCTGSIIGAYTVLTAAHCVVNENTGKPVLPGKLEFLLGPRVGTPTNTFFISTVLPYSPFVFTDPSHSGSGDLALLQIYDSKTFGAANVTPLALYGGSNEATLGALRVIGYGQNGYGADDGTVKAGTEIGTGTKLAGTNNLTGIVSSDQNQNAKDRLLIDFSPPGDAASTGVLESVPGRGDRWPLLSNAGGLWGIVGITQSAQYKDKNPGDAAPFNIRFGLFLRTCILLSELDS